MRQLPPATRLSASLLAGVALATVTHPLEVALTPTPPVAFDRIVLPTGHRPASIAVADLNHDHHPDLIVANDRRVQDQPPAFHATLALALVRHAKASSRLRT